MTKRTRCSHCQRCIQIEGPSDGSREVGQVATCPYCESSNEIKWPMGSGFTVERCDEDRVSK